MLLMTIGWQKLLAQSRDSQKAMFAKKAEKFKVGVFVKNSNGRLGQITKVIRSNPDGTKFFESAFTFGKRRNRTDHEIKIIPSNSVPKDAKDLINEVKQKRFKKEKSGLGF